MGNNTKQFLEIVDLKKGFGSGETRQEVLRGMNFSVAKGEFCVLLGPSGSGKSTLLNIIGGIDHADSGYISIAGDKLEDMSEKKLTQYRRKHLGYVFQMYNLIPNLNVKENIEVGAYLSDNALDIDELLHTLGLYEHRHKLPNQLSGGQQQRVSIGRAIVKNPVIIYENFFRNEKEDNNNDGKNDGTVRVFAKTDNINLACVLDGRLPENGNEIAVDRMHADNVDMKVGDTIRVGGEKFEVVGLIAYVNYSTLHEKTTDLMFDAIKFDVAMVTDEGFDRLGESIHYAYAWKYKDAPADEKEEKALSDDFRKVLAAQTMLHGNELKDYVPSYGNPAINFATDDMGSDMSMGGVILLPANQEDSDESGAQECRINNRMKQLRINKAHGRIPLCGEGCAPYLYDIDFLNSGC